MMEGILMECCFSKMRLLPSVKICLFLCFLVLLGQYWWLFLRLMERRKVAPDNQNNATYKILINKYPVGFVLRDKGPQVDQGQGVKRAIVTMFTTIRDKDCRKEIHNRLINNWAALSPDLDPVLFVPYTEYNTSWIRKAIANKWTVRILYALRHNLPIVKVMFKEALDLSNTPFIGYANADILFDTSLISTLRYLNQTLNVTNEMIFIVGRRRNVKIERVNLGSGDNLARISHMDKFRRYLPVAQDYFIISRRGLPWDEIPDFVVGRNGYDNWLVSKALDWNLTLIDASQTVLALHQSGIDGFKSGSRTVPNGTSQWNKELVKGFNYIKGSTAYAPYYTTGRCSSHSRKHNPQYCNQLYNITLKQRHLISDKKNQNKTRKRIRISIKKLSY